MTNEIISLDYAVIFNPLRVYQAVAYSLGHLKVENFVLVGINLMHLFD